LAIINLVWAFRSFRETLPAERRGQVVSERSMNPLVLLVGTSTQVRLNLTSLAHALLFAGMETTLGFLAWQRLGYRPQDIGWLFGGMGLVSAFMQGGVFRRLAPRTGARPLALVGFVFLAIGFALVALVDPIPKTAMLWGGVIVLAMGTGLVFPALSTMVSLAADEHSQGRAMGAFRSASSLGRAIGPLLAAMTYFSIAPSAPYWTGAAFMVVPFSMVLTLRHLRPTG
jgi:MFS family permease